VDRTEGQADLFIDGTAKISIPGVVDQVQEVCPLMDERFIIFGDTYNGTNMILIDSRRRLLADSFYGFNPVMSPNQRWIAYRKFYPRHSDLPISEEYLLYDLTKTAKENRAAGVPGSDTEDVGSSIFPRGQNNSSADHIGVPETQLHHSGSNLFYWAEDSRSVVFGDILQKQFSIVVVTVNNDNRTEAVQYPVAVAEACPGNVSPNEYLLMLSNAQISAESKGDRLIHVEFQGYPGICVPKSLDLHLESFQQAPFEKHVKDRPTKRAVVDQ
jgi:hypothetical protein